VSPFTLKPCSLPITSIRAAAKAGRGQQMRTGPARHSSATINLPAAAFLGFAQLFIGKPAPDLIQIWRGDSGQDMHSFFSYRKQVKGRPSHCKAKGRPAAIFLFSP
jgi:hypothetical protein